MTDLNPELIERANRARMENLRGKPLADHEYKALRSQVEVDALTAALSAVAPLISAQTLRDAVNELRRLDDGRTGGYYDAGRHIIKRLDARADEIEGEER